MKIPLLPNNIGKKSFNNLGLTIESRQPATLPLKIRQYCLVGMVIFNKNFYTLAYFYSQSCVSFTEKVISFCTTEGVRVKSDEVTLIRITILQWGTIDT